MKILPIILLSCFLFGQVPFVPIGMNDSTEVAIQDTISAEELFLQEIAKEALRKEARRKEITNDFLVVAVVYLLVDKFLINK